jgi:hypothetical protein
MFASPGNHQLKFLLQTPPLSGYGGGFSEMSSRGHFRVLCKPTLEGHRPMVGQAKDTPTYNLSYDNPLLGFNKLVAPTNKITGTWDTGDNNPPSKGCSKTVWGGRCHPPDGPKSVQCCQENIGVKTNPI